MADLKAELLKDLERDMDENHRQEVLKIQQLYRHLKVHTQVGKISKDDEMAYAIAFTAMTVNTMIELLQQRYPDLASAAEKNTIKGPYPKEIKTLVTMFNEQDVDSTPQLTLIHDDSNCVKEIWSAAVTSKDFKYLKELAASFIMNDDLLD